MVRSPKSIGGVVGVALGNAPYSDGDRTASNLCTPPRALSSSLQPGCYAAGTCSESDCAL
jgi:hypothetical protein